MAINTSIALGVQNPQLKTLDPMTIYQAMQDQRVNALREQMLQQDMAKNSLAMKYAAEDRAAARASAAQELARKNQLLGIFGNYGQTPAVVGERGASYSGTGIANDPNADIQNKLLRAGFPEQAKAIAELSDKGASTEKTRAETKGFDLKNIDTRLATIKSLAPMIDTAEGAGAFSKLITQIVPEFSAVAGDPNAAAARNAEAFLKDPNAWRTQVGNLTAEQLVQAHERANAPMKYSVQDTAQGIMRVPETGAGPAIPLTGPNGQQLMPVDRRAVTNIDMKGEGAFTGELGKLEAADVMKGRGAAEDARSIIETVNAGRRLLDKGVITGTGANAKLAFAKGLQQIGVTSADGSIESTEAYMSNMAQNVGKLIKQFGAGTGLSDTDRAYAEKMAAGDISFNESSLRKILTMSEQAARNVISKHNARVKDVKSQTGLTVDEPIRYFTHPDEVKAAKLPSGTHIMTPEGEKVVP